MVKELSQRVSEKVRDSTKKLEFPRDHLEHLTDVEWWYFWGKLDLPRYSSTHTLMSDYFHFAKFKLKEGTTRAIHYSIGGRYYEELPRVSGELDNSCVYVESTNKFHIVTRKFSLELTPTSEPVTHKTDPRRNYYSIPRIKAIGTLANGTKFNALAWMDHEFSTGIILGNWDWLGVKLYNGVAIMSHNCEIESSCSLILGDSCSHPEAKLREESFRVPELGMKLELEELDKETVFNPEFGIPYSETPLRVLSGRSEIGFGMRERTYYAKNKA